MIFLDPRNAANPDVPNIGLAYAATHFQVPVIDQHIMPLSTDRVLEVETDVLGISVRSVGLKEAIRLCDAYRQRYPNAAVKSVRSCLDVQCCYPFLEFEESIVHDCTFGDDLPLPDYDLFDSVKVLQPKWASGEWGYPIMTSHGCPFSCTYCAARKTGWRARSAAHCAEELREARRRWQVGSFLVIDDCFNANIQHVLEFCEAVAPLGLPWLCANGLRADRFNEELAVALQQSGCQAVAFGVESTDPAVLETIEKGESIEQIEAAAEIAGRHFSSVAGFFVIGLPGSSYQSDLASVRWALRHGVTGHFSYYVPMEGETPQDFPFYGPGSQPRSDAYPAHLQERIYHLTAHWRPGGRATRWRRLRLLWLADRAKLWHRLGRLLRFGR